MKQLKDRPELRFWGGPTKRRDASFLMRQSEDNFRMGINKRKQGAVLIFKKLYERFLAIVTVKIATALPKA